MLLRVSQEALLKALGYFPNPILIAPASSTVRPVTAVPCSLVANSESVSHCCETNHGHGHTYEMKHLIGGVLIAWEVCYITVMAGSMEARSHTWFWSIRWELYTGCTARRKRKREREGGERVTREREERGERRKKTKRKERGERCERNERSRSKRRWHGIIMIKVYCNI